MPPDGMPDLPGQPRPLPDVLVIGDSHSNALLAGCAAHGLRADMLRYSGNFWHSGHVIFHPQHGIWVRRLVAQQQQVLDLRDRLGGRAVISPDVPIIAAMGYHLGRIVPPFGFNGHVTDAAAFAADDAAQYASKSLVAAYVEQARAGHVRLARRMARFGNMVLVAPPDVFGRSTYRAFADALTAQMRAAGVKVFDPRDDLCPPGQPLAPEYITPDRVHGNDRYGAEVIGLMLARGLIGPRAA